MELMMGFDLETKRECPHCGKQIGGGTGNLKTHIKKCQVKLGIVVEEEVNEINGDKNMSLFVEVQSVDKNCPVIINLEHVVEIAPLAAGGCALFLSDGTGKYDIKVKDEYSMFKQFALETVSAEDIAKKIAKLKG
jgi:hypothetical protein